MKKLHWYMPDFADAFWKKVNKTTECWLWTAYKTDNGYGYTWDGSRNQLAHRLCWKLTRGEIPDGLCVLHHCDVPACVNPDHLFLGTHLENMADRDAKGRQPKGDQNGAHTRPDRLPRGSKHGQAKLSEHQVLEIKAAQGRQHEIAKRYGVSQTLVSAIRRGVKWAHIREVLG